MKFAIEYTGNTVSGALVYNIEECFFDTKPVTREISFDIVENKLNLTAIPL